MTDRIKELEQELKQLKELNTILSKALAAEMASNFSHAYKIQELEKKLF